MNDSMRIALYCVGNKLMGDDGLGVRVYDELQAYEFPNQVDLFDLGCLTLARINDVRDYDLIITVDALDATGEPAGTLFRYTPQDMAPRAFGTQSLHDLKLADLFRAAVLLGYECEGVCFGMQIDTVPKSEVTLGLSPAVEAKIEDLVDCVLAELVQRGLQVIHTASGSVVTQGFHHVSSAKPQW